MVREKFDQTSKIVEILWQWLAERLCFAFASLLTMLIVKNGHILKNMIVKKSHILHVSENLSKIKLSIINLDFSRRIKN